MTAPATPFAPGQRWAYRTRPGEEGSTLLILRGEERTHVSQPWHIRVDGLHLKNPYVVGGIQDVLEHIPIGNDDLQASVIRLLEEGVPQPADMGDYEQWLAASRYGREGNYYMNVARIVSTIEEVTESIFRTGKMA